MKLFDCAGVTDACVANTAADVWLEHPIYFPVSDHRDRPVDVFLKSVPRLLRCPLEVGRVQLILVHKVVLECLKHVGQQADVAYQIESPVLLKTVNENFRKRAGRVRSPRVSIPRLPAC